MSLCKKPDFKCKNCKTCNGLSCKDQMPGMGGVSHNKNFILNCEGWAKAYENLSPNAKEQFALQKQFSKDSIRLAPMTGAVENIGYADEKQFYFDMVNACVKNDIPLSIGDGCPDQKLLYGIEAVKNAGAKAAVFIKPYQNKKILERLEWASDIAECAGIDIDSYNIVTMRNKVNLENKTASQLAEIQSALSKKGIPFAVKGVFTQSDIELVTELKPDIIYVSNHGGRVDTNEGSVAEFFIAHRDELLNSCRELWIDGGVRTARDVFTAKALGSSCVLLGRPFATALCYGGEQGIAKLIKNIRGGTE